MDTVLCTPASVSCNCRIALQRANNFFKAGFCCIGETGSSLAGNPSFLHPDEKSYYDTLRVDKRRFSYLLGRKAAKIAITALVPDMALQTIAIGFGVFQFPVVTMNACQDIQVSISHCNDVAVALAFPEAHPMGIDIESIDDDKGRLIESKLGAGEFAWIRRSGLPVTTGCIMAWTIKEALSKILKTGLTLDFSILEITAMEKTGSLYVSSFRYFMQYKAVSFCCGRYVCSMVLPRKTAPLLGNCLHAFDHVIACREI